jgi:hypothetical protein
VGTIYSITVAVTKIVVIPLQAVFNCQKSFNPMLFTQRLHRYIGRYVGIFFYVRDPRLGGIYYIVNLLYIMLSSTLRFTDMMYLHYSIIHNVKLHYALLP